MTPQNVLDRLKRFVQSVRPSTAGRTLPTRPIQQTSQEAREQRVRSMATLQQEVRQLQQEIADLSARQESGAAGGDPQADAAQMEMLQGDLARKQRDLAKYQARV